MTNQGNRTFALDAREINDRIYRGRIRATLPANAEQFLPKLDKLARQRLCGRVADVVNRYDGNPAGPGLAILISDTVASEFLNTQNEAEFVDALDAVDLFMINTLPVTWRGLSTGFRQHWRDERDRLRAAPNGSGRASSTLSEAPTPQPAEDGASCLARFKAVIAKRKAAGVPSRHKDVAHEMGWDGIRAEDRISHTKSFWKTGNTKPSGKGDPDAIMCWVRMQEAK